MAVHYDSVHIEDGTGQHRSISSWPRLSLTLWLLHSGVGETQHRAEFWSQNGTVVGGQPHPPGAESADREGQQAHDAPACERGSLYRVVNQPRGPENGGGYDNKAQPEARGKFSVRLADHPA